ncbi:MAG: type I DNA topoisomerase [Bacilli bacterium]
MKLVIVESPSKSKTIEKYLGEDYSVISSKGHIRDLATTGKGGLGVDIEENFKPDYKNIPAKKKEISELKKQAKKAEEIYLATDCDREGEAISWHIAEVLDLDIDKSKRVVFNEITKEAILEAMSDPKKLDMDLVEAQEARRILDRIIGFKLSKLLRSKISSRSAGRVQSVALKIIVEREREIEKFIPEEYWYIDGKFKEFNARLTKYNNEKIEVKTEEEATKVLENLGSDFVVDSVNKKQKQKQPKAPFITSTLQQEASSKLGFASRKTMNIAQKLYEGIDIGSETIGLITYMRTDSTRLSDIFVGSAMSYIEEEYGKDYVGFVRKRKSKGNEQDAHEAIRPTSVLRTPGSIEKHLSKNEMKLYELIYARTLASLMASAKVSSTSVDLINNNYVFRTNGNILMFDGYLKVYARFEKNEDVILPEIIEGTIYNAKEVEKSQHFTQPPARYNEASLIKVMEENGIGRPSTYVQTITTLLDRKYVELLEKRFHPTKQGLETNKALEDFFSTIINIKYTADMENQLDLIAVHEADKVQLLNDFYKTFDELITYATENMKKKEPEMIGEKCPECGKELVKRNGRYGEFIACSGFPECKYVRKVDQEKKVIMKCPKCGEGDVVEKKTRKGRLMYGCTRYPDCDYASWNKPLEEKCEECGANKVLKGKKIICPDCES